MKQNVGFTMLVAVALAAARFSGGSGAAIQSAAVSPLLSRQGHFQAKPPETGAYQAGCTAYLAARDNTPGPKDPNRGAAKSLLDTFFRLDSSKETAPQLSHDLGVRYAIALAPDPVHTNLGLLFDREMVMVQQSAQDDGYSYDSSWLPWSTDTAKYPLLADQQFAGDATSHREACPGVLLFRKSLSHLGASSVAQGGSYTGALVVLVVGEQPTGGLNEDQWSNAIHWLAQNASPGTQDEDALISVPRTLRVLGPTFSGSLVSLDRNIAKLYGPAVADPEVASIAARFPKALVLSGSVSSCSSIHWYQQRLQAENLASTVSFGSFQENDEVHIFRFFSYLKALGTDVRDTAILSEDETAYANNLADKKGASSCDFPYAEENRSLRLSYPRDISALRSAYEKQSVFAAPGRSSGVHAILQDSPEQGSEGAAGDSGDTIKPFAGPMSAVAQEAVLYGVVSYLRAHHTRYLLLRCSNPLDFLFLTRFFHRAYPEGRIVTVGSDLLYRREIDTTEFRGVLALTSYPLLPLNQHWAKLTESTGGAPAHVHRVFESHMEGAYIAGRFVFDALGAVAPHDVDTPLSLPFKENIPDYADPYWLHDPAETIRESVAPTWVAVVGRDGYWPISVLRQTSTPLARLDDLAEPMHDAPPSTLVVLTSNTAQYEVSANRASFHNLQLLKFPLSWKICVGGSLLLLLYQVLGITLGARRASATGLFSVFRHFPSSSQALLLGVNSAFAAMIFLSLLSIGAAIPHLANLASEGWDFYACLVLALLTIVAIAIVLFFDARRVATYAFLIMLALLALLSTVTFYYSLLPENKVAIFYRMGHLTAGVSPLVPVLFLLAGMYLWSWQAMAGNAMLRCGRPTLPRLCGPNRTFGWVEQLRKRWMGLPLTTDESGWRCLSKSKYRISNEMAKRIANMASPVSLEPEVIGLPLALAAASWVCFHRDVPLLTMESHPFAISINIALLVSFFLTAAEAARLFWTWREFKRMLTELSRLRLRRTFAKLRAVDANSLWSVSGNVHRIQYLFFSQQLDAIIRLAHLSNLASVHDASRCGRAFASENASRLSNGPQWEHPVRRPDSDDFVDIRMIFADTTADVFNKILWPEWRKEMTSLSLQNCAATPEERERNVFDMELSKDETVSTAEEFVCFQYMAFIQNILARMRTMTMSMVFLFLGVCFAISFYPFVPRTQISLWMMANLALIGSAVIYVYAGMERDETLSYIANTRPGHLSAGFWIKTLGFLAGPLIGLLTTQFPSIAESVLGWLQPGLDAIK